MNALPIIVGALCLMAISYRYYSAFIAAKVLALDDSRPVPSDTMYDGHNYYPTNKWVLFGHHFAAISGAGPLIGPVLAAQFGYLPGLLWLIIGVTLGGAVHDFMILVASVRRRGKSLAEIARTEISPLSGLVAGIAILFIVVIALAGLGLVVVNALAESPWGTFTVGFTIPLALFMGLYMYRFRKGRIVEASVIGVIGLLFAVFLGGKIADSSWAQTFTLSRNTIIIVMAAYGFIASVLPVWMLLCPRDYLSSYLKIGTVALLIIGVIVVHPNLQMPALTPFTSGGGPVIPGKVYPFVFITIACGPISGFHSLISSGTTPKMIKKETDARFILTTIETDSRIARSQLGEFGGRISRKLGEPNRHPSAVVTTALTVTAWAAFIWSGSISTMWPMFGIANQLLAAVALCVASTIVINAGNAKYSWVTIIPLSFVGSTTLVAEIGRAHV